MSEAHDRHASRGPLARGASLALLAAVSFGVTAPLLKRASAGAGAFATAALLYAGAALVSLPAVTRWRAAGLRRADTPWLLLVALSGAVLAPTSLAWGLAHTTAVTGSLLLNSEAVFTVGLAWLVHREHVGRRVGAALALMVLGGGLLVRGGSSGGVALSPGALAVVAATFFWSVDNTFTRRLADRDAGAVVLAKAGLGALVSAAVSLSLHEAWPDTRHLLAIGACGMVGYGLSLRLYVLAQRTLGAGRTGSIFAVGPFVGALFAPLIGDPWPGATTWLAGGLFLAGVLLHLTERHTHRHPHQAVDHDHVHRHDDGHHDHHHDEAVVGEHAHPHHHEAVVHEHEHAPDLHHRHGHRG
jgi:drug/metabolite transporter (DMT)-like permease